MSSTILLRRRRAIRFGVVLAIVGVLVASAAPSGASGGGDPKITVVQDNVYSGKGLAALFGVVPVYGQSAFGPPPMPVVLSVKPGKTIPVSDPIQCIDVAITSDFALWCLSSAEDETFGWLYRKTWGGRGDWKVVANIPLYQHHDPDPQDQDDFPEESNPYGLAAIGRDVLVADAANNDVLRVNKWGGVKTVARFNLEPVSTSHLDPEEFPGLPPVITAEAVPTSIAVVGRSIYVGELKGFPFRPGSSHIYKIDADAEGATCDAQVANSKCRVAVGGLTAIQDIAIDRSTGALYVYELAKDGTFAFESGFESGDFPPAVLLQIKNGQRREIGAGTFFQPGGVIAAFGKVYVTDLMFESEGGHLYKIG